MAKVQVNWKSVVAQKRNRMVNLGKYYILRLNFPGSIFMCRLKNFTK